MHDSAFEPFVRNAWYVAAWSEEITDTLLSRTIMNEPIVLFRGADGKAAALEDRCCHRGAPLTHGRLVDGCVQCGYHGLEFDGSGACVKVPGQDNVPAQAKVISYPIVERQHFVWIWMGDPALADESKLIDYPYLDQTDQWPSKKGLIEVEANYMMLVDNLMDLTHLGFVHVNTIGGDPEVHVNAEMQVTRTESGVKLERWMLDSPPPPTYVKAVGFTGRIDRWARFEYVGPSSVMQWSGAIDVGKGAVENQDQPGLHLRNFHTATPMTEKDYYYFFAIANHYRLDEPEATEELFQENYIAFLEDKAIIEAQQTRLERDPTRSLVPIRADSALVPARNFLHEMIEKERTEGQAQAAE
jgi:phenylpropionate dioxygenase-like ring-hydroxylating dioxygenase large terminal subunit